MDTYRLNGFNRLTPFYDLLANVVFWGSILRAQRVFIPKLKGAKHTLMIGGGTGVFLAEALQTYPDLRVTYIEASSRMIQRAQARLTTEAAARVDWIHATHEHLYDVLSPPSFTIDPALTTDPSLKMNKREMNKREMNKREMNKREMNKREMNKRVRTYDVVFTFFFLDVLSPKELTRFIRHLTPHTHRWFFADFCPTPSYWRRAFIRFMYLCFRWTTGLVNQELSDMPHILSQSGWEIDSESTYALQMIRSICFSICETETS